MDSEPAFPASIERPAPLGGFETFPGMTLRDWFAGQIAVPLAVEVTQMMSIPSEREPAWVANRAYEIADAMLAERTKAQPDG